MDTFNPVIQGTEEWVQARLGKATSSEFHAILAKGQGKMRAAYLRRVVAERLTGKPAETYKNAHMDRGLEQEPYAKMTYELKRGVMLEEVGFIKHEKLDAGCSPDALLPDRGIEIKSVIPTVQIETILSGGCPPEHKAQIQGGLWITKKPKWEFCSFCPDMPERLRLYTFTMERDEAYIKALEIEVRSFLGEVNNICELLRQR